MYSLRAIKAAWTASMLAIATEATLNNSKFDKVGKLASKSSGHSWDKRANYQSLLSRSSDWAHGEETLSDSSHRALACQTITDRTPYRL